MFYKVFSGKLFFLIFIIIDYLLKTTAISLAVHQHCLYQLNF